MFMLSGAEKHMLSIERYYENDPSLIRWLQNQCIGKRCFYNEMRTAYMVKREVGVNA